MKIPERYSDTLNGFNRCFPSMNRELSCSWESTLNYICEEAEMFSGGKATHVVIKSITIKVR